MWTIGGMCYSIYLLHPQVIRVMLRPLHVLITSRLGGFLPDFAPGYRELMTTWLGARFKTPKSEAGEK